MTRRELPDESLARLLAASRAGANPAVLARARARLAARAAAPRLAEWLARPAVLAGATALFAACVAGAFTVAQRQDAPAASPAAETSLLTALLGDEDLGLPLAGDRAAGTVPGDSGQVSR